MFINKTTSGKNKSHVEYLLRQGKRDGRRIRMFTVLNITGFSEERRKQLAEALEQKRKRRGKPDEELISQLIFDIIDLGLKESASQHNEKQAKEAYDWAINVQENRDKVGGYKKAPKVKRPRGAKKDRPTLAWELACALQPASPRRRKAKSA